MPVELWLECLCGDTAFGEEVVVVGSHPALGDWCVDRGVPLATSAARFPVWALSSPLRLAEDGALLPLWIEYKYVVRGGAGGCRWEDLGRRVLPTFSSTAAATANLLVQGTERDQPANRRLPGCASRRLPGGHGVVLHVDRFGSCNARAEAAWLVAPSWGPGVAGLTASLGSACFPAAGGAGLPEDSAALLAVEVFVRPRRARLLGALAQLRRARLGRRLPAVLWRRIGELVGGDLV